MSDLENIKYIFSLIKKQELHDLEQQQTGDK